MITAENLTKHIPTNNGTVKILNGVNLQINQGESVAIVGISGSGKSTLLSILAGLDSPTTGTIALANLDITQLSEDQRATIRAEHVGFIFQSFQLLPALTAIENVMLPLELTGEENATELATQYLDRVGLSHRLQHYPRHLSGGEQQRVAVARAFACRPKVLFADEPTGNLDEKTGKHIEDLLFELNNAEGTTLILVTHDKTLAQRCNRCLLLKNGMLEAA